MSLSIVLEQLTRESKLAWRRIRSSPGPAVFAILTLALGIGVTVATYSVVYSALWRPLGVVEEDRIALLGKSNSMRPGSRPITWEDYQALVREQRGFAETAAWTEFGGALAGLGTAERVRGEVVTGSYFHMLGIRAERGRLLEIDDDRAGAAAVAVISYRTWRDQFGGDPEIAGKTIKISNRPFEIVGVAPPGFRGVHADGFIARSVWVPIVWASQLNGTMTDRYESARGVTVGLRLGPNQTWAIAAKDLTAAGEKLDAASPLPPVAIPGAASQPAFRYWATVAPTDDQSINVMDEMGRLIVGLPALVLLIACTNIANLVLSRGVARRHDFGIRRALGASRWRLIREQLIEQTAIATVGGLAGVAVAYGLVRFAGAVTDEKLAPLVRNGIHFDWSLDAGVMTSTAVAVMLSIVVAGLVPALHLTRDSMRTVLDQGGGAATPKWRGRANLIAVQVGVSVGLFLIAVVFVRMLLGDKVLQRPGPVTPGLEQLAVANIPFGLQQRDGAQASATVDAILKELRAVPGVTAAGASSDLPIGRGIGNGNYFNASVTLPGRPFPPPDAAGRSARQDTVLNVASPQLFDALAIPMRFGRAIDDRDTAGGSPVAVVNEGLALDMFGVADATGRQMLMEIQDVASAGPKRETTVTIVGVVPGRDTERRAGRHQWVTYVPFTQQTMREVELVVRVAPGQPTPVEALKAAIKKVDPELAVSYVANADVLVNGPLAFIGYLATTLSTLAFLALGLAMAGLYGVLSHVVARRTREMGIRIAIGATAPRIIWMVLRDGFRPILEGLFIGLATATVIRVFLKGTLSSTDIAQLDPIACVLAAVLVTGAGSLACYLPARRAAAVDPNVALRNL